MLAATLLGVLCGGLPIPARAAELGVRGNRLLLKSTPLLVLLSQDPAISLTGSDPIGGSDGSITFDDGATVTSLPLPSSNWRANGSRTVFRYRNGTAPGGPSMIKVAKVKSGMLRVVAKGLPVPVPNGPRTITVVLRLDGGTNVYCMVFSGTGDGTQFLVRDAATGSCAPTPTATATATPTSTGTPTPRLPDIAPPGAPPLRYRDEVFSDVSTTSNITYGTAVNNSGQTVTLLLDIYEPAGDTVTARPAIVWVHGGSFCCGTKNAGDIVDEATEFAKKGYSSVSINYRLEPGGCSLTSPSLTCITAIREAQADAQSAVRFLRANAATYGIDATRIAIAGSSAGAITALNVGFSSSEDPTAAVGGAVSLSGARISSTGSVGAHDAPSLLFHGTADTTVPYDWAVTTWNNATAAGLDSFLTTWVGAGHVPYTAHRSEIFSQTANFLYWELDLANAAQ